ncbi:tetratricopeptide repeat protein [bacterium]|nr:tetratricopeptide repeat protein [bacterium]
MLNFKKLFKSIYDTENFNLIEQTDEGTYIFYPAPESKGYEVNSLEELKPILAYWRLSAVFYIFFIMTFVVILIFLTHQIINMSCLFSILILALCVCSCLVSGIFMWHLRKFHRVKPKTKISKNVKLITLTFIFLYIALGLFFLYSCPCCIYGHYLENQEWQKALNTINFYLKLQPKNDNLYENRALAKYHLNDIDGAIEDCNKALELNPENTWVLSGKAYYSFVKTKEFTPEIKNMFDKLITEDKNKYPVAYSDRGKIHYLLGENDKAIEDFEQAYLKSGNEYFNYFAALAQEQKGDYCKAFAYYNTVPQNKHFQIAELPMKKEYAKFMCKE